jgi:hypothetical protein
MKRCRSDRVRPALFRSNRREARHAAGAHDRLGDERGDRFRSFRFDQRFEVADDTVDERISARRVSLAVVVRRIGAGCRDRQVEVFVECRQPVRFRSQPLRRDSRRREMIFLRSGLPMTLW